MKLTRNQTIKALECCRVKHNCEGCPYRHVSNDCMDDLLDNALACLKEKEPAPSDDTSSEENISCINDNTNKRICQAFERADRACQNILESYSLMSDEEQRAFDLGEIYSDILSVKCELEKLKAGEHND